MPSQSELPVGHTYRAIDNWGSERDICCVLLKVCPPGDQVTGSNHWHFEVWDGESKILLNTSFYTLIPLEQSEAESYNHSLEQS